MNANNVSLDDLHVHSMLNINKKLTLDNTNGISSKDSILTILLVSCLFLDMPFRLLLRLLRLNC